MQRLAVFLTQHESRLRRGIMRVMLIFFLLPAMCFAQGASSAPPSSAASTPSVDAPSTAPATLVIPAGTKVPLALRQAISTKTAKEGDSVYAETTFPIALDNRILIPQGTYVQGRISHIKRGGHVKGRAELLIHF